MSQYGQPILEYEPEKDEVYQAFVKFYNNPPMAKVFDRQAYSVYMTKTHCLLTNECRYLVAFLPIDGMSPGYVQKLDEIRWICFETRTMEDKHELPPHGYRAQRGGLLWSKIERIDNTPEASTYKCDKLPIRVTMLGDGKDGALWQDTGNVIVALETFETIVTFTEA
jgi:hypothetical protein